MSLSKDEVRDLVDKIEFIVDNEGAELADGYRGLLVFFAECSDGPTMMNVLNDIKDLVEDTYDDLKSELTDAEPTAVLVHDGAGDWQGLYIDDKLVAQNHSILIQDIPWDELGYKFESREVYIENTLPEWLYML